MKATGFSWVGIRTDKFDETVKFFENMLRAKKVFDEPGFVAFDLPSGDSVEIFSDTYEENKHFKKAPVIGFDVEDIDQARMELEKKGIKFFGSNRGNNKVSQWVHFTAPDGNIYELKWRAKKKIYSK